MSGAGFKVAARPGAEPRVIPASALRRYAALGFVCEDAPSWVSERLPADFAGEAMLAELVLAETHRSRMLPPSVRSVPAAPAPRTVDASVSTAPAPAAGGTKRGRR